jgi:hypothetical protein
MTPIDWGLWGVIATVVLGGPPVVMEIRKRWFKMYVSAVVDQTGLVRVSIDKKRGHEVEIASVMLLRSGGQSVIPLVSRFPTETIKIAEGKNGAKCYFQIPRTDVPGEGSGIDVRVERSGKKAKATRSKVQRTELNIVLPSGVTMVKVS